MLTPEQIADRADRFNGRANIAAINRLFRRQDESHLWPIRNRFNATERAIRRLRRDGYYCGGFEYAYALDSEISRIVNSDIG
jgi:hypothetical protein